MAKENFQNWKREWICKSILTFSKVKKKKMPKLVKSFEIHLQRKELKTDKRQTGVRKGKRRKNLTQMSPLQK